jgi:hypothetical protein
MKTKQLIHIIAMFLTATVFANNSVAVLPINDSTCQEDSDTLICSAHQEPKKTSVDTILNSCEINDAVLTLFIHKQTKAFKSNLLFNTLTNEVEGIGSEIGDLIMRGVDYTYGKGILVWLGGVSGGLIGAGTGYLTASHSREPKKTLVTTSTLGAIGGFILMKSLFSKKFRDQDHALDFDINIDGLVGFASGQSNKTDQMPSPVFSAYFGF